MYEEATKQQERPAASLLAAEAVMLEVLGDTDIAGTNENLQHLCAKSEPLFLVFTKI